MITRRHTDPERVDTVLPTYRRILREHGVRLYVVSREPQYSWRGSGVIRVQMEDSDELAHEVAHYLVATPAERQYPEYGIGESPFAKSEFVPIKSARRPGACEQLASALGIWLQARVESQEEADYTMYRHTWDWKELKDTTQHLLKTGHLIRYKNKIYPRCLVRPPRKRDIFTKGKP